MRNKALQVNIDNSDPTNYPNGRIKNNTGTGNGTPVSEQTKGDIHENLEFLLRDAGIPFNGLPDNVTNGYQIVEGMKALAGKNDIRQSVSTITISGTTHLYIPNIDLNRLKSQEIIFGFAKGTLPNVTSIRGKNNSQKPISFLDLTQNNNIIDGTFLRLLYDSGSGGTVSVQREIFPYQFTLIAAQYGFFPCKNYGSFVAVRPGQMALSDVITRTGDVASVEVVANDTDANSTTYRVTLSKAMSAISYFVEASVVNSNPALLAIGYTIQAPVINTRTTTTFDIRLKSDAALGGTINLNVLIKAINQ